MGGVLYYVRSSDRDGKVQYFQFSRAIVNHERICMPCQKEFNPSAIPVNIYFRAQARWGPVVTSRAGDIKMFNSLYVHNSFNNFKQ